MHNAAQQIAIVTCTYLFGKVTEYSIVVRLQIKDGTSRPTQRRQRGTSVGTRCAVALLMGGDDDSLFLQFKEARASVLEPYAGRSPYANHGERVVEGQRLMQAASDMFLGWSRAQSQGVDFYVRQLRDCKTAANIDTMDFPHLLDYAHHCGAALARAHAKAGDSPAEGLEAGGSPTTFKNHLDGYNQLITSRARAARAPAASSTTSTTTVT